MGRGTTSDKRKGKGKGLTGRARGKSGTGREVAREGKEQRR